MTAVEFVVHVGAGYGFGLLMWELAGILADKSDRVDQWAHRRAIIKCGQAILDYEWDRSGNPVAAHKFAHKIMGTQPGGIA
jgi:hypothetical protein